MAARTISTTEQGVAAPLARRDLMAQVGRVAMLAAGGSLVAALARFLSPNLVTPAPGPVEIGRPEEYAVGSLVYVEEARAFVGREASGFYAIVAVCTHLGCTPRLERATEQIVCPCHGSRFTLQGQVVAGPASRPLDRVYVERLASGRLFVDRGRRVGADYRLAV